MGLSVNINRRSGQGEKQWTRSGVVSPHTPPCRDHSHDAELPQYLETQRRHGPHLRRRQGSTLLPPQVLRYIHIQIYLALYIYIHKEVSANNRRCSGSGRPRWPGEPCKQGFPRAPGAARTSKIHDSCPGPGSIRLRPREPRGRVGRGEAGRGGTGRGGAGRGGTGRGGAVIQCLRQCR